MAALGPVKHSVLILEGDAVACFALVDLLEDKGYDVLPALNGRDALIHLAGGPVPDAIVLDLEKPRKDGLVFLEYRSDNPAILRIPLIVLCGKASPLPHVRHVAGYLSKPVEPEMLLHWLSRLGVPPGTPVTSSRSPVGLC